MTAVAVPGFCASSHSSASACSMAEAAGLVTNPVADSVTVLFTT